MEEDRKLLRYLSHNKYEYYPHKVTQMKCLTNPQEILTGRNFKIISLPK